MRLFSIASGSSGNSIYVGTESTHILVDAGISNKRIEAGLNGAELTGRDIQALCITHEHSDHIQSLGVLARRYHLPIYATHDTIGAIRREMSLGSYDYDLFQEICPGVPFMVGDVQIKAFSIYHDAADPVGYTFSSGGKKIAVATDMGHYDNNIVEALQGMNSVLLESNHDIRMLESGPYPYYLKRRILGERGHLSNENCGKLLCRILNDRMEHILLGHLSKENNYPDLAYEAVKCEIAGDDCPYSPGDFDITVASRENPSDIYVL